MGLFIARISRGRTIREFVAGVLIVPSFLAVIWFSAFGGTALYLETFLGVDVSNIVFTNVELALFTVLNEFPFSSVLSILAVVLILIFFVTSADSATYVLGVLASNGNSHPKLSIRLVWGLLMAATASVLLLSGGLRGLQTASIVAALPFAFIMLGMAFSLFSFLKKEYRSEQAAKDAALKKQLKAELREETKTDNEKKQVI
jgi:glycine betaine transporter